MPHLSKEAHDWFYKKTIFYVLSVQLSEGVCLEISKVLLKQSFLWKKTVWKTKSAFVGLQQMQLCFLEFYLNAVWGHQLIFLHIFHFLISFSIAISEIKQEWRSRVNISRTDQKKSWEQCILWRRWKVHESTRKMYATLPYC